MINYDIPQDPESYVHRIGRTGRAGRTGLALTLVTPREMKHLRSIEQEIKMSIPSYSVPTLEEVVLKQQSSWKKLVSDTIDSGVARSDLFGPLVQELLTDYTAEEVVQALLTLQFSSDSTTDDPGYQFGETGGAEGMIRFFINVGRNVNLTPKILSEEISRLVGIKASSIGRMDIFDNFTFVDVPEESAPFVYEALRYSRINGARVNLEPAKPRPKRPKRGTTS